MRPQAKLLALIADQIHVSDAPTSASSMQVRIGDLSGVISALDRLGDGGMVLTCETHFQVYRASRASRGYPSGLPDLLEEYRRTWMKLQRGKLCDPAVNQPPSPEDEMRSPAEEQGDLVNDDPSPNNEPLGGSSGVSHPFGQPDQDMLDRLADTANNNSNTSAGFWDSPTPFRSLLTNQRTGTQTSVPQPFTVGPSAPVQGQEPGAKGLEDGEVISISSSSDEEMMEDQQEQAINFVEVGNGRSKKRKRRNNRDRD
ncbi:hypothetical protein FBEOM_5924 [Fusarium beomiforme]|uniref:Uncharacterized protein n=1 Tax=Fusarium beomiforme TaxID=44412 RepID=A0A9P5DWR1_9HYPO|nr:hypothetical protein FBEOM_5924 [Fusarium beomiforme]